MFNFDKPFIFVTKHYLRDNCWQVIKKIKFHTEEVVGEFKNFKAAKVFCDNLKSRVCNESAK